MILIPLGGRRCPPQGNAVVDDVDADLAMQRWYKTKAGYVARNGGKLLHRAVMERKLARPLIHGEVVDHASGDRLDNTRENLRSVDGAGNAQHRKMSKNNTSGFRGVTYHKNRRVYFAYVGKQYLGSFKTAAEAGAAAAAARRKLKYLGE